jgi:hypothetical protein
MHPQTYAPRVKKQPRARPAAPPLFLVRGRTMLDATHTAGANASGIDTHTIKVTWFSGAYISIARHEELTLPDLQDEILYTKTDENEKSKTSCRCGPLPWLSLYDNHLVEVSGINATYNRELTFEAAYEIATKAKTRVLLYVGPHSMQEAPRLHLVVPFSKPLSPEKLPAMAARLNGIFNGNLTAESFNPQAQCPYGAVGDQKIEAGFADGDFINLRGDLDATAIEYNPDTDPDNLDAADKDIERLNAKHAILPIGGKTRVVTFGELEEFPGRQTITMTQTAGDFAALKNKYRHVYKDEKGEDKSVPMGSYWLGSAYRRQYDDGMAFMPLHNKRVVGKRLNLWQGYGVKPIKPDGKSGAAGCNLFLDFMLKVICGGNDSHFDYLRKREAWILQKRKRSEIAVGLKTEEEGVGKGFYESMMGYLYGNHAMRVTNPKHVIGAFNPHLETLLRLTADEALFVGNHEHRSALFGLITDSPLTIEPKGCGVYPADNYLNITVLSNSKHFVPISGTARRFFIPTLSAEHMQDFAYFKAIEEQLRNERGFEALLYHLLNEVNLDGFNVRDVPKTAGLAEQAALGRRGVDGLVEDACSMGRVPCEHWKWPGYTVTSGRENGIGFYVFIDNHRDKELSPFGAHKVIKRLVKDWGCRATGPRRDPHNTDTRISGLQWPPLAELRSQFEKRFGKQNDWLHPDVTEWTVSGLAPYGPF